MLTVGTALLVYVEFASSIEMITRLFSVMVATMDTTSIAWSLNGLPFQKATGSAENAMQGSKQYAGLKRHMRISILELAKMFQSLSISLVRNGNKDENWRKMEEWTCF